MERHWSFAVTDRFRMYLAVWVLLATGVLLSIGLNDPGQFQRIGNFILVLAVWMSMRSTLREGIQRHSSALGDSPTLPRRPGEKGFRVNATYFNRLAFRIGDATLQAHGLIVALIGSIVASYGDLILLGLMPGAFTLAPAG